jgi:hypothetical protein
MPPTVVSNQQAVIAGGWREEAEVVHDDDEGLIWEVIQGMVHEFPLCCIMEYCADYWVRNKKPAVERGFAFYRTFSLAHSDVFNVDKIGSSDIFVPCSKCAVRLGSKVKRL